MDAINGIELHSPYTEEVYGNRQNILFGDIRMPDECA